MKKTQKALALVLALLMLALPILTSCDDKQTAPAETNTTPVTQAPTTAPTNPTDSQIQDPGKQTSSAVSGVLIAVAAVVAVVSLG